MSVLSQRLAQSDSKYTKLEKEYLDSQNIIRDGQHLIRNLQDELQSRVPSKSPGPRTRVRGKFSDSPSPVTFNDSGATESSWGIVSGADAKSSGTASSHGASKDCSVCAAMPPLGALANIERGDRDTVPPPPSPHPASCQSSSRTSPSSDKIAKLEQQNAELMEKCDLWTAV